MHPHNRTLTIITAALLLLALAIAPAAAFSGAGSGTQADPYIITTPAELQAINDDLSAHYKLGNDIDLSDFDWVPIAFSGHNDFSSIYFSGSLDGDGHKISNLQIANSQLSTSKFYGLISSANGASFSSIWLDGFDIKNTGAVPSNIRIYLAGLAVHATNCNLR